MYTLKKDNVLRCTDNKPVITITKEFLDKWRYRILDMKPGKKQDYAKAQYLLVHKMYQLSNNKNA